LALMESSNLAGCSTGQSDGFTPFGILSMYIPRAHEDPPSQ
jgi:hypothetical protein